MTYYIVRFTELVVFEKGDQELFSLMLVEADNEGELAKIVASRIMQMKEYNLYSDDVENVSVGAKPMTREEWDICAEFVDTYTFPEDDDPESKILDGVLVSDTLQ